MGYTMTFQHLTKQVQMYMQRLCVENPSRRVGSQGNQSATAFFAQTLDDFGFKTESPEFKCIDWIQDGARLTIGRQSFEAQPSPYSLGCQVRAPLEVVSTVEELEAVEAAGKVLLLRGAIAGEQLMPKNFPFYNPEEHQHIIRLLETKAPLAIIAATSRNPELAGAVYPFPLIEDGDFDIPSVYMTEEEGARLAEFAGRTIALKSQAQRIPSWGCNVIGRVGANFEHRVVLCAHIDAKAGTPGALDDASGIVVLLLLAELLQGYQGRLGIEILAINGEDYYSSPGEVHYLQSHKGRLDQVFLNVNLDGVGLAQSRTAYSLYDCPVVLAGLIRNNFAAYSDIVEGEPWYQGDHMIFVMNQTPALAITSDQLGEILTHIAHTPQDRPELVDPTQLVNLAQAIKALLLKLDQDLFP
jgi:aminopeptidase YwaD